MAWSYERLWIMLLKKKIKKTKLKEMAGISSSALAHMGKDEPVTMEVLGRICYALRCKLEDIVEYVPDPGYNLYFDDIEFDEDESDDFTLS